MKMKILSIMLILAFCVSCVSVPPQLPSPANVRKSLPELSNEDKARILNPPPGDLDAIVLRADHEFLSCGGTHVGRMYQAVLEKKPDHIRANLGLGEWYVCHRKYTEALPYLYKVLALADRKSLEHTQARGVLKYAAYKLKEI